MEIPAKDCGLTSPSPTENLGTWASALSDLYPDALVAVDLNLRITHWSDKASKLLGWPDERALGYGLGSVLSLPTPALDALRTQLASTTNQHSMPLTARRMGGQKCELTLWSSPFCGDGKFPAGYLLRLEECPSPEAPGSPPQGLLLAALEGIPLPIAVADVAGVIQFANHQARELFGAEVGRNCHDIPCALDASGQKNLKALAGMLPSYWELTLFGQRVDMTATPIATREKEPDHVLYLGVPSQPHLSPELRKFFRAVDENLSGILITNAQGLVEYANPRVSEILGFSPLELVNQPIGNLVPQACPWLPGAEQPGLSQGSLEADIVCKDGSTRPVRIAISDIRGETSEVANWVVALDDISEQRQHEAREHELRDQVARSARLAAVGEITSMIAHEINQPLSCISNFSQGLIHRLKLGRVDQAGLEESLREILGQVERASNVIKNVRNMSRRGNSHLESVDLFKLIAEARPYFDLLAKGSAVQIRFEADIEVPAVTIDRSQIEQVLINLVKNAIEACKEDGMETPFVVVRTLNKGSGGVRVEIEDSAPLPEADAMARLGEPFFTTKQQGLGLGLSISRTLLENHGSHLEITALPKGKVFHFDLEHAP